MKLVTNTEVSVKLITSINQGAIFHNILSEGVQSFVFLCDLYFIHRFLSTHSQFFAHCHFMTQLPVNMGINWGC